MRRLSPELAERVLGIPKGVVLGSAPFDLRGRVGASPAELVVVLPAGVRAVKAPRFPIEPLERLRASGLPIRHVHLGPVLDPAEGEALARAFAGRSWCSRLEVAPDQVASALAGADLVLNCSRVEGFANAVAEALTLGRPVLAADNDGNRAAIVPDVTGVLFRTGDAADFEARAGALLRDPARRAALGEAARADAQRRFDGAREIDALVAAYERALTARRTGP